MASRVVGSAWTGGAELSYEPFPGDRIASLAQMALAWVLRSPWMTSAVTGASRVEQLEHNVRALDHLEFEPGELARIDELTAPVSAPAHAVGV